MPQEIGDLNILALLNLSAAVQPDGFDLIILASKLDQKNSKFSLKLKQLTNIGTAPPIRQMLFLYDASYCIHT